MKVNDYYRKSKSAGLAFFLTMNDFFQQRICAHCQRTADQRRNQLRPAESGGQKLQHRRFQDTRAKQPIRKYAADHAAYDAVKEGSCETK